MSFDLTILGSGAALPTAKRRPTSHYLVVKNRHILIDCGEGTQDALRKAHIHIQKITHIFISHLHGDHYFGLVGLLSTLHLLGRDKGLTVYGPKELEQIIRLQLEVGGSRLGFDLNFVVTEPSGKNLLFEDKLIQIWSFPLKHRIPTTGFIINEQPKERSINGELFRQDQVSLAAIPHLKAGRNYTDENGRMIDFEKYSFPAKESKSYAFCSDTIYLPSLIPYIEGVTVLYHEATFIEKDAERAKQTFHSTAKQAAEIAKTAGVQRLLLGHLSARYENNDAHLEEAQAVFQNVFVVDDGFKLSWD